MKNVEKTSNCIFKSERVSLRYFEYVIILFGSLSSQNIENQQITSANYTVLMLRVRQNERKKAFGKLFWLLAGRRHIKSNTNGKDVRLLLRYC